MRVLEWVRRASSGKEHTSGYRGVFSYATEYHAFIVGIANGVMAILLAEPLLAVGMIAASLGLKFVDYATTDAVLTELQREPWYAISGVAFGYVIPPALIAIATVLGEGVA